MMICNFPQNTDIASDSDMSLEIFMSKALKKFQQQEQLAFYLYYLKSEWITSMNDLYIASQDEKSWAALRLPLRFKLELRKNLEEESFATVAAPPYHFSGNENVPKDSWQLCYAEEQGAYYYYNNLTGESQWAQYDEHVELDFEQRGSEGYSRRFTHPKQIKTSMKSCHVDASENSQNASYRTQDEGYMEEENIAHSNAKFPCDSSDSEEDAIVVRFKTDGMRTKEGFIDNIDASKQVNIHVPVKTVVCTIEQESPIYLNEPLPYLSTRPNMPASAPPLHSVPFFYADHEHNHDDVGSSDSCAEEVDFSPLNEQMAFNAGVNYEDLAWMEKEQQGERTTASPVHNDLKDISPLLFPRSRSWARFLNSSTANAKRKEYNRGSGEATSCSLLHLALGEEDQQRDTGHRTAKRVSDLRSFDPPKRPSSRDVLAVHLKPAAGLMSTRKGKKNRLFKRLNIFGKVTRSDKEGKDIDRAHGEIERVADFDSKVQHLCDMGYSIESVFLALQFTFGNVQEAAVMLLECSTASPNDNAVNLNT